MFHRGVPLIKLLTVIISIFASLTAVSQTGHTKSIKLIVDTEVEEFISNISTPLLTAAGNRANSIKIHLIQDPRLNAFMTQGNRIFIHSGLILEAKTPDEISGVIAHEIGHNIGRHLARRKEAIDSFTQRETDAAYKRTPTDYDEPGPSIDDLINSTGSSSYDELYNKSPEFKKRMDDLDATIASTQGDLDQAKRDMTKLGIEFGVDVALTVAGGWIIGGIGKGISLAGKAIKAASVASKAAKIKAMTDAYQRTAKLSRAAAATKAAQQYEKINKANKL